MDSFFLQLLEYWWAFGVVILAVAVGVMAYVSFLKKLEKRIAKAWLAVYETYLRRADKLPLLIELIRRDAHEYEPLAKEALVARRETQGMSLPSMAKRDAERALSEVVTRVLEGVSHHETLKKNVLFLRVTQELSTWDEHLPLQIVNYSKALMIYRIFSLGHYPQGYERFEA